MNVIVKLFAGARELAGQEEISIELPTESTVGQLRDRLIEDHAELRPLLSHALFAIDAVYCSNECRVPDCAEIACIPPCLPLSLFSVRFAAERRTTCRFSTEIMMVVRSC